jgi:hypothetical protein
MAAAQAIAIVGMGPRGLSVLERLLIRLRDRPRPGPVVIWTVDPVEHGPGRVWRTTQPWWLTMNATAGEVTVHSPDTQLPGEGFVAPRALSDWTGSPAYRDEPMEGVDYPPRRVYGEYLRDMFRQLCANAPPGVEVRPVLGEATRLRRVGDRLCLALDDGRSEIAVDKVVLATGHARRELTEEQQFLRRHATRHPDCRYLEADIAPDMPLADIAPGATVAVRGLGLTFYDVIRTLSVGRGGEFVRDPSGRLRYLPSGREPVVAAGSRSGLPFLARPRVTEPAQTTPRPIVLTERRIAELRSQARTTRGTPQLDFAREVEPLVQAEVDHAYYACAARLRHGPAAAEQFMDDFGRSLDRHGRLTAPDRQALVARHRLDDLAPLRLDLLARPFDGRHFSSPPHFRRRLLDVLRTDVAESRKGPLGSPLKAALDVLRQIRPLLPSIVDFGGLLPPSHEDFVTRFEPLNYLLSAGPPDEHVEQLVALIEAGVLDVVGPAATFGVDDGAGRYVIESPAVDGSRRLAQVMVEARVPSTDIRRTASPLTRQMVADGLVSQYVNVDRSTGDRYETGGLAVTGSPFHVVDARGRPDPDVYAIGVATDKTRWFTQVGTGRPGQDSPFCRDADAIASDILDDVRRYPVVVVNRTQPLAAS